MRGWRPVGGRMSTEGQDPYTRIIAHDLQANFTRRYITKRTSLVAARKTKANPRFAITPVDTPQAPPRHGQATNPQLCAPTGIATSNTDPAHHKTHLASGECQLRLRKRARRVRHRRGHSRTKLDRRLPWAGGRSGYRGSGRHALGRRCGWGGSGGGCGWAVAGLLGGLCGILLGLLELSLLLLWVGEGWSWSRVIELEMGDFDVGTLLFDIASCFRHFADRRIMPFAVSVCPVNHAKSDRLAGSRKRGVAAASTLSRGLRRETILCVRETFPHVGERRSSISDPDFCVSSRFFLSTLPRTFLLFSPGALSGAGVLAGPLAFLAGLGGS